MRGYPGGMDEKGLDPATITQILVFVHEPKQDHVFQVTGILATGSYEWGDWSALAPDKFFPMIDEYGQFVHKQWPGKTHNDGELAAAAETEAVDLAAFPGPEDWNQYGGWTPGPQLKATGYFYPEKHAGKWWLVDPEGRLFWSHGVDCVGYGGGYTPITDREFYFANLPAEDSPLAVFYGTASWAPHGYYEGKRSYRTFNFAGANLSRKYGENWREEEARMSHSRLRSWSMNTIANWSDSRIYLQRKTPYVVSIHVGNVPRIEGSSGYWGKFPDPFDPLFREGLERRMSGERDQTAGDKWCIGYFVDNELAWGDDLSLAKAALASPARQPAKQALLGDLKQKYVEVQRLNAAWGTAYESWNAMEQSQTVPGDAKANADLGAFTTRIAEEYFRICRDVVKHVAPRNLYLGCRFAWVSDRAAKAAAEYCDVIGYNLYRDSVADFQLPAGIDKPVIIGEFHFGALDRGMFHTGLRPTASQEARAKAYRDYVTGALKHPHFVGTHWFQYRDQTTTGRGDGENYQIGLVDICDRPYPETIRAVREVGASLYRTRME
ncbi:MAG: beta-agarase [Planctomycetes bacterium]|nr:beta-agarase [Planctomycetota bacterium]